MASEISSFLKSDYIDGATLKRAIVSGTQWLGANKEAVNALNVFPVPDGDTGTNMHLTLLAALREIEKLPSPTLPALADAWASGALMGARGNSGVIFSQLVRGFSQSVDGKEVLGPRDLVRALTSAADTAYKAVMKPVEGTILTVAREAARAAASALREGMGVVGVLEASLKAARVALERTPQMLQVLAEAGVVDAGGKGLVIFMEGALAGLKGENLVPPGDVQRELTVVQSKPVPPALAPAGMEEGPLKYRYCTEFLLKGKGLPLDKMREELSGFGDCLLVVGTPDVAKVHIHTNNPGLVLEYCGRSGHMHDIQINNMEDQREEFVGESRDEEEKARSNPGNIGVVACAVGEGFVAILKSLGADVVVRGGQTMNPSIEDISGAISSLPQANVLVLPNNPNIILTAQKATELVNKNVIVIPTRTIPQGIAALVALNRDAPIEANRDLMTEAVGRVRTGEVTYAARNSNYNGFQIGEKDIIGIHDGELKVTGKDRNEVVTNLLSEMISEEDSVELITVYYGADVTGEEAKRLTERIAEDYPRCEVELQYGGQPFYYYIISVE